MRTLTRCDIAMLAATVGLSAGLVLGAAHAFTVNTTDSIDARVLLRDGAGEYLRFCPPGSVRALMLERAYLPRREHETCPGWPAAPLIKPIVARAGDEVLLDAEGVHVNGRLLANSRALEADRQGAALPQLGPARFTVGEGEVWVVSQFTPRSFDSRYFGPVRLSEGQRFHRLF